MANEKTGGNGAHAPNVYLLKFQHLLILSFFIGLLLFLKGVLSFYFFSSVIFVFIVAKYVQTVFKITGKTSIYLYFLLGGYLWGDINFYVESKKVLPLAFEGKNIQVEGRIEAVPIEAQQIQKFLLNVDTINHQHWKGKISLSWYKIKHRHYPILIPGERWRFTVKIKRPHGFRNPGIFDYEAWLFEQKIKAKGYIVTNGIYQRLEKANWHNEIDQIRQRMGESWQGFSEKWPLLGVLLALTVGLTGNITPEQWKVFTNTGTVHLISISGFHINLMAGIAYGAVNFFWRRIPYLCERWPAQRAGAIGAIFFGALYSLLAGSSIPTERSFITLSIFMGGLLFQRKIPVWNGFLWSIFIVIVLDPFAPLNLSFWLTYSAVGIILYSLCDPLPKKAWYSFQTWVSALKLQWQIFLGLIPFSLFWFSQVSVSSLWANLVAIPVTGFFILPFALMAVFLEAIYAPLAIVLMQTANWFQEKLYLYLRWISEQYPVIFVWSLSEIWMLLLGVLGVLLLLLPKGIPGRWLGIVFWLPLFFPVQQMVSYGEANIKLLDVGQGLAAIIQTQNHWLVFDTGPKFSDSLDAGQAVILPYLRHEHVDKIDAVVISHKDLDHSGGLQSILKYIPVSAVWVNDLHIAQKSRLCKPNIKWQWDGVSFQFLTRGLKQLSSTNNTSCVLKISNGMHSILLPGDLEAKAEKVLIKEYGHELNTDLLVAGHHGSKTSSSSAWIKMAQPRYVLFATGYLNRYHFPNKDIVQRYEKMGAHHYSTADCGMISWTLARKEKGNTLPQCYVKEHPLPWFFSRLEIG